MSEETVRLLMFRYTDAIQDLKEGQNQFPLSNRFEDLGKILEDKLSDASAWSTLIANLYKLLDILEECQTLYRGRKKHAIPAAREWFFLRTIKLRLSKIEIELRLRGEPAGIPETVPDWSNTSGPYGLDVQREDIVSLLEKESDNLISPIGIVGVAGSGKTTLARLVYNDDGVRKEFIPRIWVSLSRKTDSKTEFTADIVKYLLKQLCEDVEVTCDTSLDDQLATLYQHLSGKKYLIVFDDVWHIQSWYKMLVNLEEQSGMFCGLSKEPGGRIIITSRLQTETKEMIGPANVYKLIPTLDRDSCWSIFTDVLNQNNVNTEAVRVANFLKAEILDTCNGHPLAAKILAMHFCKK